jgi:dienelactone hydrolase
MNRRELLQLSAASTLAGGVGPSLASLVAEEPKLTPDELIRKYLATEVERISRMALAGVKTKDEWQTKRPQLKQQFLDMLGLNPLPEKTDLKATITGTVDRGDVVIEKMYFQSRPGLYVTGNLYRPKTTDQKRPAILYVCGHSGRGRDGNKTAFQDHGMWFAQNGYVCLIVDTLQLGEVAGKHHGTYNLDRFWWHSRGYTPAGVECLNGIRAIDYLCSRPDVDPDKIGVTGISGGGATTVWVAAADDRVKVAVPVSGISDLESYVKNKVINGHCDCMFVHNTYQWEWTTILALFAPRPLLFANSDKDPIFPMDGNRRIIARLRACYEMLGAKDKVDEHVSPGGHDYRPDLRLAIFRFFHTHLKGDQTPVKDAVDPKILGKELRVFPEDSDLPKDSINATADEVFVPRARVNLPAEPKEFPAWKAGLMKQLREQCFRAIPEKVPAAKRVSPPRDRESTWIAEPGIELISTLIQANPKGDDTFTLIVLNPDENAAKAGEAWINRYPGASVTFAMHPRGGGDRQWTRKNPPNTVERSLALLGQTVDSGRVRDVVAVHSNRPPQGKPFPIRLVGTGPAGIIAAYAAMFPPGVDHVVILDPPTSHRDGPHFLNVMRILDIPESLGLLAPDVSLTLVGKNATDKAFDKTAAIYKLAGAEAKFKRE